MTDAHYGHAMAALNKFNASASEEARGYVPRRCGGLVMGRDTDAAGKRVDKVVGYILPLDDTKRFKGTISNPVRVCNPSCELLHTAATQNAEATDIEHLLCASCSKVLASMVKTNNALELVLKKKKGDADRELAELHAELAAYDLNIRRLEKISKDRRNANKAKSAKIRRRDRTIKNLKETVAEYMNTSKVGVVISTLADAQKYQAFMSLAEYYIDLEYPNDPEANEASKVSR